MLTREKIDSNHRWLESWSYQHPGNVLQHCVAKQMLADLAEQARLAITYREELAIMQSDSTAELLKHRAEREALAAALASACAYFRKWALEEDRMAAVEYVDSLDISQATNILAAHDAALIERCLDCIVPDGNPSIAIGTLTELRDKAREGKL